MREKPALFGVLGGVLLVSAQLLSCQSTTFAEAPADDADAAGLDNSASFAALALLDPACGLDAGLTDASCSSCVLAGCSTEYAACFGPRFTAGEPGGSCIELATCASGCECGDASCFQSCADAAEATAPATCADCLAALKACADRSCSEVCAETAPAGTSDAGANGSDATSGDAGAEPGDAGRS